MCVERRTPEPKQEMKGWAEGNDVAKRTPKKMQNVFKNKDGRRQHKRRKKTGYQQQPFYTRIRTCRTS